MKLKSLTTALLLATAGSSWAIMPPQIKIEPQHAINMEMGRWMADNFDARPEENICMMSGTLPALLDLLRSGVEDEAGLRADRLRQRFNLTAQDLLDHHQSVKQAVAASRERAMVQTDGMEDADELLPDYAVAQALVLKEGIEVALGALDTCDSAEVYIDHFAFPQDGVDKTNDFVCEQTDGAIPTIIDSLSAEAAAVAVSAARVKGGFIYPFEDMEYAEYPFENADGTTKVPEWMQFEGHLAYSHLKVEEDELSGLEVIELPCYGDLSLVLFGPNMYSSGQHLRKALQPMLWGQLVDWALQEEKNLQFVHVVAPRVEMNCETDYLDTFAENPVIKLFVEQDYNGGLLTGSDAAITISQLVDKHVFKLGPKGFFMAGAAAAVMELTSCIPDNPIFITFNQSFGFMVVEKTTGTVIGAGLVKSLDGEDYVPNICICPPYPLN